MSAIRPNRNFDNETITHIPYSKIIEQQETYTRGYLKYNQPTMINKPSKSISNIKDSPSVRSVYNKFFK